MWKVISKYKNIEPYSSDKVDIETCIDSQKPLASIKKNCTHGINGDLSGFYYWYPLPAFVGNQCKGTPTFWPNLTGFIVTDSAKTNVICLLYYW